MIDTLTTIGSPAAAGPGTPKAASRDGAARPATAPETERPVMPVDNRAEAKQLEDEINRLIEQLLASNLRLRIHTDAASGSFVYQGIDRETGEVKSQWPSDKILSLRAFLRGLDGLLVDKTA